MSLTKTVDLQLELGMGFEPTTRGDIPRNSLLFSAFDVNEPATSPVYFWLAKVQRMESDDPYVFS